MHKPSCETLVTSLEATALHDAAHDRADQVLHGLALRMMELSGLEHIGVGGSLDDGARTKSPLLLYASRHDIPRDLAESGLYDVCLLRRTAEAAERAGAIVDAEAVQFTAPLESWSRTFPVVATRYNEAARVVNEVYDGRGKYNGIFLVSGGEYNLTVHDCLVSGVAQVHRLPLRDRIKCVTGMGAEPPTIVERPSGLCLLPPGRWLLRTHSDGAFDASVPLGLLYDAQVARPGQYVKPPKPTGPLPDGEVVVQDVPVGSRCQLHRNGDGCWFFVGDAAVDCVDYAPQVSVIARSVGAESFILDCVMVADSSARGLAADLRRRKARPNARMRFVALDCLYLDGNDLHDAPLSDRLECLRGMSLPSEITVAEEADEPSAGSLVRPRESAYPLDWCGENWHQVPRQALVASPQQEAKKPEQDEPEEAAPDRQLDLSRGWFERGQSAESDFDFWCEESGDGSWHLHLGHDGDDQCLCFRQDGRGRGRRKASHEAPSLPPGRPRDGIAILGVQRDDMHEVFLHFNGDPVRSGRYLWQWHDEEASWLWWRPEYQAPHLTTCDAEEERASAESRSGWIAWNADALRLLSESPLSHVLPLNWDSALEEFDFLDDVDLHGVQVSA